MQEQPFEKHYLLLHFTVYWEWLSMTNEEIAIQIQAGNTQYYTELWESVRWLMHKILHGKLLRLKLPNYLTSEDMEQELYFALCNAVQAYDDTKPYKLNSYLEYHIMNALRSILPRNPLQECSYNQTADEDESTELIEFIPDDVAAEKLTAIELTDIQAQTRQAVAELPYNERKAITLYYFKDLKYKQVAKIMGVDEATAKKQVQKGLKILRQNKAIQSIYDEVERHYTKQEYIYQLCFEDWCISKEHRKAKENIFNRRQNGEYISYGTEQTIMYQAQQKYIKEHKDNLYYRYW